MKKIILLALILFPLTSSIKTKKHRNIVKSFSLQIPTKALAATALDGSTVFTTDLNKANFVRYYYYLVNGPSSDYTMPNNNMNYVGIVNGYLDGLNSILASNGYSDCDSIPTSGSATGSVQGMSFDMAFSAGTKSVPSSFPNDGGETYDKRMVVSQSGSNFLEIQLKCSSASMTTGYILMGNQTLTEGTMYEAMFQMDSSTNLTYLDFVVWVAANRKFVTRFTTDDGDSYKLYTMYLWMGNYIGAAINGTANGVTNFNTLSTSSTTSDTYSVNIHDVSSITNDMNQTVHNVCLDMSNNTSTTGCSAITSAGTMTINGTSHNFNFSSMSGLTTSTIP